MKNMFKLSLVSLALMVAGSLQCAGQKEQKMANAPTLEEFEALVREEHELQKEYNRIPKQSPEKIIAIQLGLEDETEDEKAAQERATVLYNQLVKLGGKLMRITDQNSLYYNKERRRIEREIEADEKEERELSQAKSSGR